MKTILLTCLLLITFSKNSFRAHAQSDSRVEVLARIQTVGHAVNLIRVRENDVIPSILQDKNLEKIIAGLVPGDEALVSGHITYQSLDIEGHNNLKPIFVIESIKPISLKRLGNAKLDDNIPSSAYSLPDKSYAPISIPISTEVASAITLTTTILLMQSLTASASQPQPTQQLNAGLFLFAGAIATGVFIYEQIKGINTK